MHAGMVGRDAQVKRIEETRERNGDQRPGGATPIRRRQPSSATVQSFCFAVNHRLVGPPLYGLPRPWPRGPR